MSKSAQASRQTLFFVFDRYGDNETWAEGRGEASRRQKQRGNPSAHRVVSATFLDDSARTPDVTDEMRREAILACLADAEAHCHLASGEDRPLGERTDAIVNAAAMFGLEPGLYKLAWSIRKWAAASHTTSCDVRHG